MANAAPNSAPRALYLIGAHGNAPCLDGRESMRHDRPFSSKSSVDGAMTGVDFS